MLASRKKGKLGRYHVSFFVKIKQFWTRVKKRKFKECWLWQGALDISGYGRFWCHGNDFKSHRFAWILARGEIPDGMCVLHRCDNPQCVNPDHLFLGTNADNTRDMLEKGRGRGGRKSRLSSVDVSRIKKMHVPFLFTIDDIAAALKKPRSLVCSALYYNRKFNNAC